MNEQRGRLGGVLAIDAGNSKTDVALIATDGRLVGTARGGPFHPHRVGAEAAVDGLAAIVRAACADAGLVPGEGPIVQHVSACFANADLPPEHEALEIAVAAQGWGESSEVFNDTFAVLRAGLDEPRGIAVVCGAGINCSGVLPGRTPVRFAAVGHISGDWGGGGALWQEAMWWAARAEDGRGPDTRLRTELPRHFGLDTMAELIEAVHLGAIPEAQCLELTPVLFAVATDGDATAAGVVRRQAEEVVALVLAAMRRLDVLDEPIDVVLGGGVITGGHALLMDEIHRLLRDQAPFATTTVVRAPPVVGAALLGLDRIGAPAPAREQLRESFRLPTAEATP
jgi:N-acetylglucosamine kinase-like BadF-type ATPase